MASPRLVSLGPFWWPCRKAGCRPPSTVAGFPARPGRTKRETRRYRGILRFALQQTVGGFVENDEETAFPTSRQRDNKPRAVLSLICCCCVARFAHFFSETLRRTRPVCAASMRDRRL